MQCGIVTHLLGIHAILGFFLAGVMAGSIEEEITFEQRESLANTVHAVFVPIFFATIGTKTLHGMSNFDAFASRREEKKGLATAMIAGGVVLAIAVVVAAAFMVLTLIG